MARHWVKFNVFFETLDDDNDEELFEKIVDAVTDVIDPACASIDWSQPGNPPEGHRCTRDWTAGSCSLPALSDEASEAEFDMLLDTLEEGMCPSCGRPFPDAQHRIDNFHAQLK